MGRDRREGYVRFFMEEKVKPASKRVSLSKKGPYGPILASFGLIADHVAPPRESILSRVP